MLIITQTALELGFLYALGLAEIDPSKKGPFAKYLPDDDE